MNNKKEYTMLVVDDNKLNQKILTALFSDDYNIINVDNGVEALEMIEQMKEEIDIVMLDLFMPRMDGFETLQRCRELPYFKEVPVVIITSSNALEDQILAFELGASDFVTKPFVPEIVTSRVNNIMNSRRRFLSLEMETRNMKSKAELDQMTGLYNKATAKNVIDQMLKEYPDKAHAMLLVDIDNFKAVNDLSGHLIGDHTIKIVADLISGHFRKTDVVARVGGDEFVVLMTDVPGMDPVREKVNELIQCMRYKPNLSIPDNVSLSIGFTAVEKGEAADYDSVFARADEALYVAKQNGKAQAREYGVEYKDLQEMEKKLVLLVSRNRNTCSTVCALTPRELSVKEFVEADDLARLAQEDIERAVLAYIDVSEPEEEVADILGRMYELPWMKNIPVVPLCAEGNLLQYRAALDFPVEDLLGVPIDVSFFKRRVVSHLKKDKK